jgi:hypothetical protein
MKTVVEDEQSEFEDQKSMKVIVEDEESAFEDQNVMMAIVEHEESTFEKQEEVHNVRSPSFAATMHVVSSRFWAVGGSRSRTISSHFIRCNNMMPSPNAGGSSQEGLQLPLAPTLTPSGSKSGFYNFPCRDRALSNTFL